MKNLEGLQRKALLEALESAFPSYTRLKIMLMNRLDERLERIAGENSTLEVIVFNLIEWAEAQGKLEELIRGAYAENPGNSDLQRFVREHLGLPEAPQNLPSRREYDMPKSEPARPDESFSPPPEDFVQVKKHGLERRLAFLQRQWIAENDALMSTLDAAAKVTLSERMEQLEQEMAGIEKELHSLHTSADISPVQKRFKTHEKDAAEMVWIPAGMFQMGGEGHSDEHAIHAVRLPGFWMYRAPVTVGQYQRYCEATGKTLPDAPPWGWQEDHPIVNVSWEDASGYCEWAGVRLPTEAEWEYAARGGLEGKQYPWGDEWDGSICANSVGANKSEGTKAVGSYAANGYGLSDMSGNVWEWCEDWFASGYYQKSPAENPQGPEGGIGRVVRGGSWNHIDPDYFRCASRSYGHPLLMYIIVGFRPCASEL